MSVLVTLYFSLYIALLFTSRSEPLLFLRLAFLGAPGAICSLALWNGYIVSVHLPMAQTPEFLRQAIVLSGVGLLSARVGWTGGVALSRRLPRPNSIYVLKEISVKNLAFILFVMIGIWFSEVKGASILERSYASGHDGGLPIGNVNAIINILLGTLLYFYFTNRKVKFIWHIIGFIIIYKVIYINLLRGIRADALDTMILIFIIIGVYRSKFSRIRLSHIMIGILFLFSLQIIGGIRSSFYEVGFDRIRYMSFIMEIGSAKMLNISTIGPITATYLGYLYLADGGYVLDLSRTYLGYVLRIPPEFVYPGRPTDIAWVFKEQGLTSGGGSFELGEAYLTLGAAGVVVIPAIISGIFAFVISRLRRFPTSIILYIVLVSLLAVFSRGAWYQTFAYFKSFITGLIWLIPILYLSHTAQVVPSTRNRFSAWSPRPSVPRTHGKRTRPSEGRAPTVSRHG